MSIIRICCLSDTHGLHKHFDIPDCEILVHAGDFCNSGQNWTEITSFNEWIGRQKERVRANTGNPLIVVAIAGNHDKLFEGKNANFAESLLTNVDHYLLDSGCEVHGLKFWGSPYQPEFCNWAFNVPRGAMIRRYWDKIPAGTDVLITHGPPHGRLDKIHPDGKVNIGCEELRKVTDALKPKIHVFGHIHGGHGIGYNGDTFSVNASGVNEAYNPINDVTLLTLVGDGRKIFVSSHGLSGKPKTPPSRELFEAWEDSTAEIEDAELQ